jgi:hypothetical protein
METIKISKIEAHPTASGFSVVATYENGSDTIFGSSKVVSGANRMVTTYANMMNKKGALAEGFKAIKFLA